jgi:hypothetical protein
MDAKDSADTYTSICADVCRSPSFSCVVLGGKIVAEGRQDAEPTFVRHDKMWLIISAGGGAFTDDNPATAVFPPGGLELLSAFLNLS